MLDNNAHASRGSTNDPPLSSAFVSNESVGALVAAKLPGQSELLTKIDEAFAAAKAVGGGEGIFAGGWTTRKNEVLFPSYQLLLLIHNDPGQLARAARESGRRLTKTAEKNPALVCIQLAARPHHTDENKLCSDWSAVLRCAFIENVSVDEFIAWVGRTTVGACKQIVAEQQRIAREEAGIPPRKRVGATSTTQQCSRPYVNGESQLKLHLDGSEGPVSEVIKLQEAAHTALLDALTCSGSPAERRRQMAASLRVLADELVRGDPTDDRLAEPIREANAAGTASGPLNSQA